MSELQIYKTLVGRPDPMKSLFGNWYFREDVDAEIARLKAENVSLRGVIARYEGEAEAGDLCDVCGLPRKDCDRY